MFKRYQKLSLLLLLLAITHLPLTALCELDLSNISEARFTLEKGKTFLIDNLDDDILRVSIGDGSIVKPEILKETGDILLIGLSVGDTDLRVWFKDGTSNLYNVSVSPSSLEVELQEKIQAEQEKNVAEISTIRAILGSIRGIEIKSSGDRIIVDGAVSDVSDLTKIENGISEYENVISLVSLRKPSVSDIRSLIGNVPGLYVREVNGQVYIDGELSDNKELERIQAAIGGFPNVTLLAKLSNADKSTILVKVQFIEISKSTLREIGIKWQNVLNGPAFGLAANTSVSLPVSTSLEFNSPTGLSGTIENNGGSNNLGTYFGITTSLVSTINLLDSTGNAQILAEPLLTSVNGGSASFLAGGEFPLPTAEKIEFKEYGIRLDISPTAFSNGIIDTLIEVEVSTLDYAVAINGIPGIKTRRATSQMNIQSGQTMVLAGLVSAEDSRAVTQLPVLGNIPVLGRLFRSESFKRNQTELAVLITPQITGNNIYQVGKERAAHQLTDYEMIETPGLLFDY